MSSYMLAVCVCFGLVAIGEIISYFTKAVVPSMAGALILYLIFIWIGMPQTYPETAGFTTIGDMAFLMLCVGLGTNVAPAEYIKNIKSVVMAFVAVVFALVFTVGIGGIFFGFDTMLAGAGACCGGGAISGIAALSKLNQLGLVGLLSVPTILIVSVDPLGQPISSFILRKYAKRLNAEDAYLLEKKVQHGEMDKHPVRLTKDGIPYGSEENPSPFFRAWIPSKLEADGVVLLEMALTVWAGVELEKLTTISSFLWVFLLGILGCTIGLFRMNLFDERSHSAGFLTVLIIGYLFTSMNGITPQSVLSVLPAVIALIVLSAIGLALGGYISGKLMGYDPILSAAAGVGIMFLFPGITIISNEVSARVARNDEEKKFIYGKIAPSMYIMGNAGFLFGLLGTVTILLPLLAKF
ncbi:MAG: hypothetical protein RR071_09405 [Lachnospiraceae bacterium]